MFVVDVAAADEGAALFPAISLYSRFFLSRRLPFTAVSFFAVAFALSFCSRRPTDRQDTKTEIDEDFILLFFQQPINNPFLYLLLCRGKFNGTGIEVKVSTEGA